MQLPPEAFTVFNLESFIFDFLGGVIMNVLDLTLHEVLRQIRPEHKIGEGRFREAYQVGDSVVKVMKRKVHKNYGLFSIDYPARLYIRWKFGINDYNQYEHLIFRQKRLPP